MKTVLAQFADEIRAAVDSMDETALRTIVTNVILGEHFLSAWLALPADLRERIDDTESVVTRHMFLNEVKGYVPVATHEGDCSVGTFPFDAKEASLAEEEQCLYYVGHLAVNKDEETIVDVHIDAQMRIEAISGAEAERSFERLRADITWHKDPSKHAALVEVLPDIMAQAELPQTLLEFLQGVGTLTDAADVSENEIALRIRTRALKRKRDASLG